jgi:hypothetical protein
LNYFLLTIRSNQKHFRIEIVFNKTIRDYKEN